MRKVLLGVGIVMVGIAVLFVSQTKNTEDCKTEEDCPLFV